MNFIIEKNFIELNIMIYNIWKKFIQQITWC